MTTFGVDEPTEAPVGGGAGSAIKRRCQLGRWGRPAGGGDRWPSRWREHGWRRCTGSSRCGYTATTSPSSP